MSSASSPIWHDRQPLALTATGHETHDADRWLERANWAFVGLGVSLRIARYLMNYPLWWDEAFVAVNFIRRDYLDLLRPLDYGQVCPILFLWCELSLVKVLGFSEWSLRLFPLICAVASVVLFRHVAGRVVRGVPLLLAVAIFATSFHPILHAADVKPYASDLLASLMLLAIAVEWCRTPERAAWLWVMAAVVPIALALSHPAIFIAAGIVVGLAPTVARTSQRGVWTAYAAFTLSTGSAFLTLYLVFTQAQASASLPAMQAQGFAAFPSLHDPCAVIKWMATVHTGGMFAYPCGGERGASSLTFLLFTVGAAALWLRGGKVIVLTCLSPFALALVAAAMRRYPYGGPVAHGSPARIMQYLAPCICLLTGIGGAVVLTFCRDPRRHRRAVWAALGCLTAIGIIPLAADAFHPYRAVHAHRAREFARRFWPEFVHGADTTCLLWDLGIGEWNSTNLNVAVYLCNQMIYSPQRRHAPERRSPIASPSTGRPLRYIVPLGDRSDSRPMSTWLSGMMTRHELRESRTLAVDMANGDATPRIERYGLYEFVPRRVMNRAHREGDRIGVEDLISRTLESRHVSRPELFSP